ncbi:MAG: GNAT family N-acetyltransferase [Oscillospiraceae bacterium]
MDKKSVCNPYLPDLEDTSDGGTNGFEDRVYVCVSHDPYNRPMLKYRKITVADDSAIAKIIRTNLERYNLDIPGTVYFDPELDHLSSFYNSNANKRNYFIALNEDNEVIGGVGVAEFAGIPECAELQKLYLDDPEKGKGYGKELMNIAETWAKEAGYKQLYLETHSNLEVAIKLYEKLGFHQIEKPKAVLHGTMDHFYLKNL